MSYLSVFFYFDLRTISNQISKKKRVGAFKYAGAIHKF